MAKIEQWEKDLRKQLTDVKTIREAWEDDLDRDLKSVTPKSKKKDSFFGYCLILLLLALVFAYCYKMDFFKIKEEQSISIKLKPGDHLYGPGAIAQLEADIAAQQEQFDKLAAKVQRNSEKISLMGTIMNENFVILRDNKDKNQLLMLQRDWTVKRMPSNITLTEEDKEFLGKYVQ